MVSLNAPVNVLTERCDLVPFILCSCTCGLNLDLQILDLSTIASFRPRDEDLTKPLNLILLIMQLHRKPQPRTKGYFDIIWPLLPAMVLVFILEQVFVDLLFFLHLHKDWLVIFFRKGLADRCLCIGCSVVSSSPSSEPSTSRSLIPRSEKSCESFFLDSDAVSNPPWVM